MANKKSKVVLVEAPEITLGVDELVGDTLLNFYRALGWNGNDTVI